MSDFIEVPAEDLPYTVVGHTPIPSPTLAITLTGAGIKALAAQITDDDRVRIKEWADCSDEGRKERYYQRITIIRKKPEEAKNGKQCLVIV